MLVVLAQGYYFPDLRAHPADLQGCVEGAALASVWVGAKGAREEGCFPCLLLNPSTAPSTALRGFKRLVSKGDARLVLFLDASEQDAGTTQVVTSYGCVDAHKLSKWSSNEQGDKILDICRCVRMYVRVKTTHTFLEWLFGIFRGYRVDQYFLGPAGLM